MRKSGYSLLPHTTDAYIEAVGATLEEAMQFAGIALIDTICNVSSVSSVITESIEGLKALGQLARPQPILLRTKNEIEGQNRTREQLALLLSDLGFPPVLEFKGNGDDDLSQLLTAITFADYVSAYLAILRGVEPSELSAIPSFREAMRGK